MTFLKHLSFFQLNSLLRDKCNERNEFKKSIKASKENPILFNYLTIRSFNINVTRLNREIKEIKLNIEFHPEAGEGKFKKDHEGREYWLQKPRVITEL